MYRVIATLEQVISEGAIPSAAISVRLKGEEVLRHAAGQARLSPPQAATCDTPYDLASVTKPFAGGAVAAALIHARQLKLSDLASHFVRGVDPRITVQQLLVHGAGYPPWSPLFDELPRGSWGTASARTELLQRAATTPLAYPPGEGHAYSDLGFLVLLAVLEAAGGAPIDELLQAHILAPAGVTLRWGWPGAAATEDCPVRGHVVQGEVHDLNCLAMGGRSTHAGLFGTASAVSALAESLLDAAQGRRHDLPGPALAKLWATRGQGSHRAGWDGVSVGAYTSTGRWWPAEGVGHLGYTGTSVWVAPAQRAVVALLTNRVHPRDDKGPIRAARPRIHDAVAQALGWDRATP